MLEEELVRLWKRARREIDVELRRVVERLGEAPVLEASRYIVEGGKRLRGFTTLLIASSLGAPWSRAMPAAVAVELLHSASLAVDDVVDGDRVRRGAPAAWLKFGPARALLAANLLASYAFKMLLEAYGSNVMKYVTLAWFDITRGEVRDAYLDTRDYVDVVRLKTGSLFRLAAELGGVAAGVDEEKIRVLGEYGEIVGIAYQLADDAVDWIKIGARDPSAKRLAEWLGVTDPAKLLDAVIAKIRSLLSRADSLLRLVVAPASKLLPLLTKLPRFAVRLMLAEVGVNTVL